MRLDPALCVALMAGRLLIGGDALAEEAGPANTLAALQQQFEACMDASPMPWASQITVAFMVRRDGSVFGKPRVTFSHLVGDDSDKKRFLIAVEGAMNRCLPLKITPALGGAIAGRLFTATIGAAGKAQGS